MRGLVAIALCASLVACLGRNAAPPPPERIAPRFEEPPIAPEPGTGRLIIDVVDGPARVDRVLATTTSVGFGRGGVVYGGGASTSLLCARTPCAANLPYGDHQLKFQALDNGLSWHNTLVQVRESPKNVRVKLGELEVQSTGSSLGSATLIAIGIAAMSLGAGFAVISEEDAGWPVAGAGGAALIGGVVWMIATQSEITPGSDTQWVAEPEPEPAY